MLKYTIIEKSTTKNTLRNIYLKTKDIINTKQVCKVVAVCFIKIKMQWVRVWAHNIVLLKEENGGI